MTYTRYTFTAGFLLLSVTTGIWCILFCSLFVALGMINVTLYITCGWVFIFLTWLLISYIRYKKYKGFNE